MLHLSFGLLVITALLGGVLAVLHLHATTTPPRWPLGSLHGFLGVSGLALLLLALRGPSHGEAMGVGSFGRVAAVLLALALLAGLTVLVARLRHRRAPGLLIGVHATAAVSGVVVLAAYVLLG